MSEIRYKDSFVWLKNGINRYLGKFFQFLYYHLELHYIR